MSQLNLFAQMQRNNFPCPFYPKFMAEAEADAFFAELSMLPWDRHVLSMYGKEIPAPRFFQWMGVPPSPKTSGEGRLYGKALKPMGWTPAALAIKARVEAATGDVFNSLNLNFYRDHHDYLGWHIDKEDEGVWTAPIASVSLGAVRTFQVRKIHDNGEIHSILLTHGSLVVMPPHFQEEWLHRLAKTSNPCGPRVNLTFRCVKIAA